ncbi:MAG TPA: N-acetylmuramoyl-L-alanine amidase, partial [Chitinophagaceae bacterium]|nr:N-acetylmuramoyl-L-alanine amidase [Chitinophagaceae bacterium]
MSRKDHKVRSLTIWKFLSAIAVSLLCACSAKPFVETNRLYKKQVKQYAKILRRMPLTDSLHSASHWVGTTHFNLRKPNYVIIHHTAQNSCAQTLKTFTSPKSPVSAHYVICRDGTVYHMLNDYLRAWHGGVSRWGSISDINSSSIGIELDNNGAEPFPEMQVSSLLNVLSVLKNAYAIPESNFIVHADVAPARKQDPSRHFPWKTLAEKGYGLWYTDTTGLAVPGY